MPSLKESLMASGNQFAASTPAGVIALIEKYIRDWLVTTDLMPSREDVLKYADEAFDKYVGPMIKRPLLRAAANELLLFGVGLLYDEIAS